MLETERLILRPLSLDELKLQLENPAELEKQLGFFSAAYHSAEDHSDLLDALPTWIKRVQKNQKDYIWFTNWMLVNKESNTAIGGVNLTRMGTDQEQLLIGYHVKQPFRRLGFASEAVQAITDWAFSHSSIKVLLAETLQSNASSESLLKKLGFQFYEKSKGVNIWVLHFEDFKKFQ